jgi:hypothetical protein
VPLHKSHATLLTKDEVAAQRIHDHEDHLVKRRFRRLLTSFLERVAGSYFFIYCQSWHERLVRKEASRKHQDRDRNQKIREREEGRPGSHRGLITCLLV